MKKRNEGQLLSLIIAAIVAASGVIFLVLEEVLDSFFSFQPKIKLIIILVSVFCAYHPFLCYALKGLMKSESIKINETIYLNMSCVNSKLRLIGESITFAQLEQIEKQHGSDNRTVKSEMWIIANSLQEAKKDKNVLSTIYDNITLNNVHYYYVLPETDESKEQLSSLIAALKELHNKNRKRRHITGGISCLYDNDLNNVIPSEYFDIVLFIDCDDENNPKLYDDSSECEGYYCFSSQSKDNEYIYQKIKLNKVMQIRRFYSSSRIFENISIGGI